jgi:septal ring factor EnvC (AmiA/AmiB activator)
MVKQFTTFFPCDSQKELERKNHLKSLEEKDVWLSTQEKKITELEKEKAKLGTELKEEKKKNGMLHDENVQLGCRCPSLEGENINLRQENRTAREVTL